MTTTRRLRNLPPSAGLAAGSAISGVLAYVFFAMVTRALGAVAAAPVSVLWVWWGFAGAALTFPLQHWISRSVTARGGERVLRDMRGKLAAAVVGPAVLSGVLAWLARDQLFDRDDLAFPLLTVAITLGAGLLGVVRGTLTARRRFFAVGASLAAENALRCLAAVVLLVAGAEDPVDYGACLVVGYFVVLLWPSAMRFRRDGAPQDEETTLALVGGVGLGQLLAQLALTGGPILLALAGGPPQDVTALFAGLALFRAPYTLTLGLVAPLTSRLTALVVEGREREVRRFRRAVVLLALIAAVLAAGLGALLGPTLMELIFGPGIRLAASLTAVLAVGTVFAMMTLVLTLMAVARGRPSVFVRAWLLGAVPGALLFELSTQSMLERTCWTFLVVEATVAAWLVVEDVVAGRRSAGLAGGQEDR